MDHDRSCPGCTARDREIADLRQRIAELEKHLEQRDRAGKRQAAPFSKNAPKPKPKRPGRQSGPAHGDHGHRPPPPAEVIDEVLEAPLPEACPHCGGAIAEDPTVDEQFQTDIPTQPVRRKFRIHKGCCQRCRRRVRGRHPLQTSDATGAAGSQLGPNAQASIVYLNKRSGMSYGKIADYLHEANGITFKPSTATRIVLRTAGKLKPAYAEIQESIPQGRVITPDETGWRNGGRFVWLHAWVGEQATCYAIDPQRSADALERVIGLGYDGTLIHDGAATYDRFTAAAHQQCVAHALRRAHDLAERQCGRAKDFPRQVIDLFQEALGVRDAYRAGERCAAELADLGVEYGERLYRLTQTPRLNGANETFASHLHRYGPQWFTFLQDPELPATNYLAEQALRTPIVNRKVFGGNRTDAGCQAQVITASTIQTCKQQEQSGFAYIRDTVCGLARSIFAAVTGGSAPAADPAAAAAH